MRKFAFLFVNLAVSMAFSGASQAQTRDIGVHGELLDRIAAIVNDGLVLKSELDAQIDGVVKRLQEQKIELPSQSVLKQQVLDRLIVQEIQTQQAKRVGLTVSDEQLNSALQEIASRNKIPFDQLPTALAAQGVDYKQYRESMRKELTLTTLRQRDVISHINVSPHELDQYLAREQSAAANDEFNVSHILLSLPEAATPQQLDEITHKAQDLAARASKGEDFAQLAIANSNSQTALDGGHLGWTGPGPFVPEFDKAIADLKVNEISQPFKTHYGWHIVQMLGTRTYDSTDDVRRQRAYAAIRESKADEETELWLRRLRDEAFVEIKM